MRKITFILTALIMAVSAVALTLANHPAVQATSAKTTAGDAITLNLTGKYEFIGAMNIHDFIGTDENKNKVEIAIVAPELVNGKTYTLDDCFKGYNTVNDDAITDLSVTYTTDETGKMVLAGKAVAGDKTYDLTITVIPSIMKIDLGAGLVISEDEGELKLKFENDKYQLIVYISDQPKEVLESLILPTGTYKAASYSKFGENTEWGYMAENFTNGTVDVVTVDGATSIVVKFAFGLDKYEVTASTVPTEIADLIAGKTELALTKGITYTLNKSVELVNDVVTINANGASIKVGAEGQLNVQKGIIINDAHIDASASSLATIQLSATPDASLATFDGETPKYANATFKGYEASEISLNNCTFITNNSLIRPAANWVLRSLNINNCIVEAKYKSGKALINMEENGAANINNIVIKNSTLYADDAAAEMRLIRYAAQNDPWRVWGYEGEDKNATMDNITIENSTIVGLCGNKEFANNIKNTKATILNLNKNVFVNTWRINKIGGNLTRNFAQADNLIMGGTNAIDGTDANWFTAVDDLGIVWNYTAAPSADGALYELAESFAVYEPYAAFGDPRWAGFAKPLPAKFEISDVAENKVTITPDPAEAKYVVGTYPAAGRDMMLMIFGLPETTTDAEYLKAIFDYGVVNAMEGVQAFDIEDFYEYFGGLNDGDYVILVAEVDEDGNLGKLTTKTVTISTSGITSIEADAAPAAIFNIAGQRINAAKGIIISKGRKMIVK